MRSWLILLVAAGAALAGCTPGIGDSCATALNCSITGERVCDASQPGGSCTIFGCEMGNCPPEAVCVRWRPMASRLEFTACMRRCESDGDCRVDQGYRCVAGREVLDPSTGTPLAELAEEEESRFCVATELPAS